jgi:hypothetical protein
MEQSNINPALKTRSGFVDALVGDLIPVAPAPSSGRAVSSWFALAGGFVVIAVSVTGPMREGAVQDLATLRLSMEFGIGLATAIAFVVAGLEIGVPGGAQRVRLLSPALGLAALWIALALAGAAILPGFDGPASSMLGKREHCFIQGIAIGLLPTLLALRAVRSRALHSGPIAGLLVGVGASTLPALAMQIACMYDPGHALRFHLTPILVIASSSAIAGAWLLRDR